jgi:tripartite ATP-independent transporter DctP family solute receptor
MTASQVTRRHVNLALAASGITLITNKTRAAEITLKHNHNLPEESPLHKRATEMWAAVKAETGGRVDVQISRGEAGLDKLVAGEPAFMTLAGNGLSAILPAADVQATPYGFRNPQQVYRAMDGDLGAYLTQELRSKGLYAVPGGCFENGMHQITCTTKPIRSAADLQGLKMRIPGSTVYQDFFRSLGAQVFTMNLTRTYDGLKNGTVEAQDDPWDTVELFKMYEIQKFASITDHSWSGYNMLASLKVWQGLPADVQRVIETNTRKYAALQRADGDKLNEELRTDLTKKGMAFNDADKASFRAVLASYYPKWKAHIGQRAWDLLESNVGKLG